MNMYIFLKNGSTAFIRFSTGSRYKTEKTLPEEIEGNYN